jgi:Ca2+-binding EF-hand superfamily protein
MGGQMPPFSSFDANSDGFISEDELAQGRAERIKERSQQGYRMRNLADAPSFDAIDQNNDGQLDRQEFATAQRQHMLQQQMQR